jgi:hypothetical protein
LLLWVIEDINSQFVVGTVAGVEDINSQFETTFSLTSCFDSITMSSVGWYVDNGTSRHMKFDKSLFNKI